MSIFSIFKKPKPLQLAGGSAPQAGNRSVYKMDVVKGQRFNLTKESGGATNFYIGLGWNANAKAGEDFDLDASMFVCKLVGDDPKLVSDGHFVYFGNLKSPDGAVVHSGDNLTGDGAGDDEQIRVYLDKLPAEAQELSIVVCIYQANARRQNFGRVSKAYVHVALMDPAGNPVMKDDGAGNMVVDSLCRFPLSDDYSTDTAIQVGQIYKRDDGAWAFNATGAGFAGAEIADVLATYAA